MLVSNEVNLSGTVSRCYPLKHTPFGLPVVSFVLEGTSTQIECGLERQVKHAIYCILVGDKETAKIDLLGRIILIKGFLSNNKDKQIVLHVKQLTFLDKGI